MAKNLQSNVYEGGLTVDPTAGAGVPAAIGSILPRAGTPQLWQKIGAGDTEWEEVIAAYPNLANFTTYFDDFLTDRLSTFATGGAGTNAGGGSDLGNNHPGTNTQTVTVAAVDVARIIAQRAAAGAAVFFGGGPVLWETIHEIPVLSDGVNRITLRVGMHDAVATGDVTDGVYLEYDLAANGNQNYWLCAANNSVRTKVDTGIVAVAAGIRKARIFVNAGGTSATCTIDGVAGAAAVAANIPTTAARNTFVGQLQLVKSLGAGALSVIHDYYYFRQIFTVAR